MNELIGSFAGKRLAIFGVLIAAIALLVAGGTLSLGTTEAQTESAAVKAAKDRARALGWDTKGLDHIQGGSSVDALRITLAINTRHTVCLMNNIGAQQYRGDSTNGSAADEDADPPMDGPDGDTEGDPDDVDDLDWDVLLQAGGLPVVGPEDPNRGNSTDVEVGPKAILSSAPTAATGGSTAETSVTGWNWVIAKKAGTAGTPTISNPSRTFPNRGASDEGGTAAEACVFWTSTAPGTQVIQLYRDTLLVASGQNALDLGRADSNDEFGGGDPPNTSNDNLADGTADDADAATNRAKWAEENADVNDPTMQLEVTWVDSDPLIRLARLGLPNAPQGAAVGDAPIPQRMVLTGAAAAQSFQPAGGATIRIRVEAIQSAVVSQALTGASVSFAVTGDCGAVTVPGAVVSAGPPRVTNVIKPGQTGTIDSWGTADVEATFSNVAVTSDPAAPTDVPACKRPNSSTTLTVTSGAATATVAVNWGWDGYGEYTTENVDDTTKKVTFHTAIPRTYVLGQATGWMCDDASKARSVSFDLDGRASVAGFARRNTVGTDGPTITSVTPASQGATTPKRTLGAQDSECQVSWTVRSPARADDVYLDISSLGVDAYSELLSFAPEAPAVATLDDLEDPLDPGIDFVLWTGDDTAVSDAIGDSGAIAVYYWVSATQSWLSFFPGSAGLGVNNLTTLQQGEIYVVSTPSN